MRIVDANVLLYAVNQDARHHAPSRAWLDRALGGADTVGFAWVATLAFLRLSTRSGVFPTPLPVSEAIEQLDTWMNAPGAAVVDPTSRHLHELESILGGVGGDLAPDAHLAALAAEHRAEVVTYDRDFARFEGIRIRRPDDLIA